EVRVYNRALSPAEASVVPLLESISQIAAIPPERRTQAQSDKLAFCFLDQQAPRQIREALCELRDLRKERDLLFDSIPTVMVMQEGEQPRDAFVLKRGAYNAPGEKVAAAVPAILPPLHAEWQNNRLGLARWLVDRSNPLTARVTVNRLLQMLFGAGLVKALASFLSQA